MWAICEGELNTGPSLQAIPAQAPSNRPLCDKAEDAITLFGVSTEDIHIHPEMRPFTSVVQRCALLIEFSAHTAPVHPSALALSAEHLRPCRYPGKGGAPRRRVSSRITKQMGKNLKDDFGGITLTLKSSPRR